MLATLIMRGRSKASRTGWFKRDALDEAVEAQIEVKPRLLAIRDDIQPGGDLILNRHLRRIVLHFRDVGRPKAAEVLRGKFKPAWKRITANDGGAERLGFHYAACNVK